MSRHYDLFVVGSGVAASGVASRVRQAGRSEALFAYPTAASDIGYML